MIKKLKDAYPKSNIVPIDFDAGISEVNQINRIKLMLTSAFRNLKNREDKSPLTVKSIEGQCTKQMLKHLQEQNI